MKICVVCGREFEAARRDTCSKLCAGRYRNKDWIELNLFMSSSGVKYEELAKKNYSPGMIYDILCRDCGASRFTLGQVRDWLKSRFAFDIEAYNKQPQAWKLKFKYPADWTEQQILEDIKNKAKIGQSKTIHIRNVKGNTGNTKFKREDSPLCLEFYISRGLTAEQAKKRMLGIQVAGALGALKSSLSGLEKNVSKLLLAEGRNFESEYRIKLLPEERVYNKNSYFYDFYLPDERTVIECHGVFWHASPEIYKSGDVIKLPGVGETIVDDIWKADQHKKMVAESRGLKYEVVWESK